MFPALGMPYIPTQNEEGETLPFDAIVGTFFLQYKVPEFLTTRRSREWHELVPPGKYFRFAIYPESRSRQHNLMREVSRDRINVYYCTPGFSFWSDYSTYHSAKRIAEMSAFIPVDQLPANHGSERHSVVYRISPLQFKWCSDEAIPLKPLWSAKAFIEKLKADKERHMTLEHAVQEVSRTLDRMLEFRPFPHHHHDKIPPVDARRNVSKRERLLEDLGARAFAEENLVLGFLPIRAD